MNLPVGLATLVVTAVVMRLPSRRSAHRIDYLGMLVIAPAATCLVLVTSLGGIAWPWGSWQTVSFTLLAAALVAVFIRIERRAAEPVLPPRPQCPGAQAALAWRGATMSTPVGQVHRAPRHLRNVKRPVRNREDHRAQ